MKTLFAGVAAISAALCANAAELSGDTGTTFAGLTAETAFDATQAENNKYFWRTEATSVGTIESYTTLGAYSGTRATQWASTDASGVALKLDTEKPLIRLAEGTAAADGAASDIDANGVYIDTLVQFGVYYETPEMVSDAKFGIWGQEIDGTVKLVVRAGKYVNESLTANDYIVSTDSNFDFEAWHRITVKTSVSDGKTMFKLFIDGAAAVATTGETEFPGLVAATTISSLVFNGCGAVDDILFTKTVPEMDAIASVGGTYFTTLADAVAGANGATVTLLKSSSENITLPADGSLTLALASGATYDGEVTTASGYKVEYDAQTGTYTSVRDIAFNPASIELYPNSSNILYVTGAPAESVYRFKTTSGLGNGGYSSSEGWLKVYGNKPGAFTATATVTNNNEEIAVLTANITVKDVYAVLDDVEYSSAQMDTAVAAAISSGKALGVYPSSYVVTLNKDETIKWYAADNRGKGSLIAKACAATEQEMYKIVSTKDAETGVTTATCVSDGAPNVMITDSNNNVSYAADLTMSKAGATYKLLRSFTKAGVLNPSNTGMVLDLNGQTLTLGSYIYVRMLSRCASLTVRDTSAEGTGAIVQTNSENPLFWVNAEGNATAPDTLNIEGGTFTAANGTAVYVYNGGIANISGGTFSTTASSSKFLLNSYDKQPGTLKVTGGTFHAFNPANNTAEGAGTNFVDDGYASTETAEGSGIWVVAIAPSGYDSGDGVSTFTIDETAEADVKTKTGAADLGAQVPGKTYSYAQAYAAGLIDLTAQEPIKELKPVIEIDAATGKVKVGFDTKPLNGFKLTLAIYAATEPGDVDAATPLDPVVVEGDGEAQLTTLVDRATGETKKFYKVKIVKIENK